MRIEDSRELAALAEFPDMNPGPVCRLLVSGRVILANAAAKRLFGEHELLGRTWQTLCPGLPESLWSAIVVGTEPLQYEADFGARCVLFTHVRSSDGETIFVFGSDVTSLRAAERKLAEVARFPEMNPGPVLRMNLEGSILLANAAAQKVFGKEIVGQNWLNICPGVTAAMWQTIHDADEPVLVEAQVQECIFVFTHCCDAASRLVFAFGADITKQKLAEKALRQSEKMATLGTLAAGVAHELNNPAAATRRAADQLRDAVARLERALLALDTRKLTPLARETMRILEERAKDRAARPNDLDTVSRSDLEAAVEEWLDEHSVPEACDIAPALVAQGITSAELSALESVFTEGTIVPILQWMASAFPVYSLLYEISQGSERISEIVGAMKGYSYLGQAPLQLIDVHEGLDNTLIILRSKLKDGITVRREYQRDIPRICAYGSELNQVWTNLLDNAAEALDGNGEISIRTSIEDGWAIVSIQDNGPGIPENIQYCIFDPFFTTKAPGKGTGLGLSTTYSIIHDMHKGQISLQSRPGNTVFTVKLLIDNPDLIRESGREESVTVHDPS